MRMCPNCGASLVKDEPVRRGKWELHLTETHYDGVRLPLSPKEAMAMYTIAIAAGYVSTEVLGVRLSGDELENPSNTAKAFIWRAKHKLEHVPWPIRSQRDFGYIWEGEPLVAIADMG